MSPLKSRLFSTLSRVGREDGPQVRRACGLSRLLVSRRYRNVPLSRLQRARNAVQCTTYAGLLAPRSRGAEKVNFAWPLNRYRYYVGEAEGKARANLLLLGQPASLILFDRTDRTNVDQRRRSGRVEEPRIETSASRINLTRSTRDPRLPSSLLFSASRTLGKREFRRGLTSTLAIIVSERHISCLKGVCHFEGSLGFRAAIITGTSARIVGRNWEIFITGC